MKVQRFSIAGLLVKKLFVAFCVLASMSVAAGQFRISAIEKQYITDTVPATPHPVVFDMTTGAVLAENEDYVLAWEDNTRSGTGKITISGKAGSVYEGETLVQTFEVQMGIPFRTMSVAVNRVSGAIVSFDVELGKSAAANPLYLAWGPEDGGVATNGWANLVKVADVSGESQVVNVPITAIPAWGDEAAKFARFFICPGSMMDSRAYFQNRYGVYTTAYYPTDEDFLECVFVNRSGGFGHHVAGAYDADGNRLCFGNTSGGNAMRLYFGRNGTGNSVTLNSGTHNEFYGYTSGVRNRVEISKTHAAVYTNGLLVVESNWDYAGGEFACTEPVTLFQNKNYVSQKNYGPTNARIYSLAILRDGVTKLMVYPVSTNGVCCYYDAASSSFVDETSGSASDIYWSNDIGPKNDALNTASPLIRYTESPLPEIAEAYAVATNLVAGRIFGAVQKLGEGATSVDVYFACAVKGTEMPELKCVQTGLVQGGLITAPFAGLESHLEYDYVIDLKNSLGETLAVRVTGTFTARPAHTWTGGAGNDDFLDAANWDIGAPQDGADVTLPAGAVAILSQPTPALYSLAVAGTLTTSGWMTKVEAGVVTVANGGTVTCEGPFTDAEMSNRVWIVCTDLMVDAGGAINVNDKGYAAGFGPGRSPTTWIGASHGGFGGGPCNSASRRMLSCDDVEDPVQPGSGGNAAKSTIGTPGGGVVRIEATGTVTVNGSIFASATQAPTSNNQNSYGAGGSISISCARFAGADGFVRADAAVSGYSSAGHLPPSAPTAYCGGSPGGGGRIAIRTSAQEDGLLSGVTISASEGFWNLNNTKRNYQDAQFNNADMGTIWINDARLLESLGTKITGKIYGIDSLSLDNLTISSGHVRFSEDGFKLSVAGDLVVQGESARLEIGGAIETNRVYDINFIGFKTSELTVGGDFSIIEGARFDVWSSVTNDGQSVGAKVTVGGTLTVGGSSSRLVASCDEVNGGAPKFSVGSFEVDEGGIVTADGRGFGGGTSTGYGTEKSYKGKGPGGGNRIGNSGNVGQNKYIGGGYGGIGGWSVTGGSTSGLSYGDEWRPSLPGSGGAGQSWASVAGAGGGVIDVTATTSIRIDGTVSANGWRRYFDDANVGGGSGGSIWLKAPVFTGASTGVITANGQSRTSQTNGGAGGGGRIAIWTGSLPYDGSMSRRRVHKQATAFTMPDRTTYAGAISADGGTNSKEESVDADGKPGSVWFVNVDKPGGLMLLLR